MVHHNSPVDLWNNCSDCGKSIKFGRVLVEVITNIYSYGPNSENQNGGSGWPFWNHVQKNNKKYFKKYEKHITSPILINFCISYDKGYQLRTIEVVGGHFWMVAILET